LAQQALERHKVYLNKFKSTNFAKTRALGEMKVSFRTVQGKQFQLELDEDALVRYK
jgi:hypothetical protein